MSPGLEMEGKIETVPIASTGEVEWAPGSTVAVRWHGPR